MTVRGLAAFFAYYRVALAVAFGGIASATLLATVLCPDLDRLGRWAVANDLAASRHSLQVSASSDTPRAVYLPLHEDRIEASLDGQPLIALQQGESGFDRYRKSSLYDLPGSSFRLPSGTLLIEARHNRLPVGLGPIYVGPRHELLAFASRAAASINAVNLVMPVAAGIGLALALALIFMSGSPARFVYVAGFLVCTLLAENDRLLGIAGFSLRSFENYLGIVYFSCLALAISHWWNRPSRERQVILSGAAAVLIVVAGADIWFGFESPRTFGLRIIAFVGPIFAVLAYWALLMRRNFSHTSPIAMAAAACMVLGLLAVLLNIIRLFLPLDHQTLLFMTFLTKLLGGLALLLLCGVSLWYEFGRYAVLRRETATLDRIVSGNNLENDLAARNLKLEIETKAFLEERSRLTRDLHDGLSGQLLSLLLKARSGSITPQEVERELEDSLSDLRLISTAMDSVGLDLGEALEAFRLRIETQVANAGLALDWKAPSTEFSGTLDQRALLNLLRILQEAITNAIRHAGANRLEVTIAEANGRLAIAVGDNGRGLSPELAGRGTGLRNMHQRCEQLGGELAYGACAGDGGTRIDIAVPLNPGG